MLRFDLDHPGQRVRLTAYGGSAAGRVPVPAGRVYQFGRIAEAHAAMEASQATGQLVVLTGDRCS